MPLISIIIIFTQVIDFHLMLTHLRCLMRIFTNSPAVLSPPTPRLVPRHYTY